MCLLLLTASPLHFPRLLARNLIATILCSSLHVASEILNATHPGGVWPAKHFVRAAPIAFARRAADDPLDPSNYLNAASALWFQVMLHIRANSKAIHSDCSFLAQHFLGWWRGGRATWKAR